MNPIHYCDKCGERCAGDLRTYDEILCTACMSHHKHDTETDELRAEIERLTEDNEMLTEDNEMLKAANRHMANKLVRIVELCAANPTPRQQEIRDVAMEQLPPHDPAIVEMGRADMLKEIDDALQKAGCWRGGRLDSVLELITRHNGMKACLKLILEWMDRDGSAIRSWVEEVK